MEFWNQRSFCLVTGASRGIGKTIAVEFGKKVGPGSVMLLVARSASALEETKAEVLATSSGVKVVTAAIDLAQPDSGDYLHMINSALITTGTGARDFQHSILVHNAGSLGNIGLKALEWDNLSDLRTYYDFNLLSMILLTSQFFKIFKDRTSKRSMIQISSLGALTPFKTWSAYCAGKAARDMFMKSVAAEDPSISTLNYAPGPTDTDIYTEASSRTGDTALAKQFQDSKKDGTVLSTIQTITKLVRILGEERYTKGEHIDYYDLED